MRLKPDTNVCEFEAVLAFGARCGAQFALVAGNDPDLSRLADNLNVLGELSLTYGIKPHLEFMPWTDIPDLRAAISVTQACESANVGVLVDAFHLNRSSSMVEDIPPGDSRFGYCQLCDIAGPRPVQMDAILHEARAQRLNPGDGDCPLTALLARLPDGVPISLEVPNDRLRNAGVSPHARALAAMTAALSVLGTL